MRVIDHRCWNARELIAMLLPAFTKVAVLRCRPRKRPIETAQSIEDLRADRQVVRRHKGRHPGAAIGVPVRRFMALVQVVD